MTSTQNLLVSLDKVLEFSSKLIALSLREQKPKTSQVDEVRHHCEQLSKAGIYAFDAECDDQTLFKQIEEFAEHING